MPSTDLQIGSGQFDSVQIQTLQRQAASQKEVELARQAEIDRQIASEVNKRIAATSPVPEKKVEEKPFIEKYKTYLIVGVVLAIAVIGYFVYSKYWK